MRNIAVLICILSVCVKVALAGQSPETIGFMRLEDDFKGLQWSWKALPDGGFPNLFCGKINSNQNDYARFLFKRKDPHATAVPTSADDYEWCWFWTSDVFKNSEQTRRAVYEIDSVRGMEVIMATDMPDWCGSSYNLADKSSQADEMSKQELATRYTKVITPMVNLALKNRASGTEKKCEIDVQGDEGPTLIRLTTSTPDQPIFISRKAQGLPEETAQTGGRGSFRAEGQVVNQGRNSMANKPLTSGQLQSSTLKSQQLQSGTLKSQQLTSQNGGGGGILNAQNELADNLGGENQGGEQLVNEYDNMPLEDDQNQDLVMTGGDGRKAMHLNSVQVGDMVLNPIEGGEKLPSQLTSQLGSKQLQSSTLKSQGQPNPLMSQSMKSVQLGSQQQDANLMSQSGRGSVKLPSQNNQLPSGQQNPLQSQTMKSGQLGSQQQDANLMSQSGRGSVKLPSQNNQLPSGQQSTLQSQTMKSGQLGSQQQDANLMSQSGRGSLKLQSQTNQLASSQNQGGGEQLVSGKLQSGTTGGGVSGGLLSQQLQSKANLASGQQKANTSSGGYDLQSVSGRGSVKLGSTQLNSMTLKSQQLQSGVNKLI